MTKEQADLLRALADYVASDLADRGMVAYADHISSLLELAELSEPSSPLAEG